MSAATAGRLAIDHLIEVIETGAVPSGDKGTLSYVLQQLHRDKRGKRTQTQQGTQP